VLCEALASITNATIFEETEIQPSLRVIADWPTSRLRDLKVAPVKVYPMKLKSGRVVLVD